MLPNGTRVLSADSFGSSAWTVTARVNVILEDGTPKSYFLKVCIIIQSSLKHLLNTHMYVLVRCRKCWKGYDGGRIQCDEGVIQDNALIGSQTTRLG